MRQFCEHPGRSTVGPLRATSDHQVAEYLAGYAEALADRAPERHGGVADD
ncbi:hypothetical protein [Mycolicibacterium houstonense]|nr:hypothetical protein [Mycolicibacterium houstonense]